MKSDTFDILNIIAIRKSEFFNRVWSSIDTDAKTLSSEDKINVKNATMKIISNMDNILFLSEEEKKNKIIKKNLSISKLNLDEKKIWNNFKIKMKELYPGLDIKV